MEELNNQVNKDEVEVVSTNEESTKETNKTKV